MTGKKSIIHQHFVQHRKKSFFHFFSWSSNFSC